MNTRYAVWSDKGRYRSINEDNFFMNGAVQPETGLAQTTRLSARCSEGLQLFAVCDGMGGEASGEKASAAAANGLAELKKVIATSGDMAAFRACVAQVNRNVIAATEGKGGSTATGVIISGDEFITVNAGDSRTYLIRGGRVRQLTKDHSQLQQLLDSGALKPEEAANYAHKNVITRHFGMSEEYGEMELTLTAEEKALPGDRFLICSDGVHGEVTDMEIAELAGTGSVQEAAARIAQRALENGTRDNLTAMVIEVCAESAAKPAPKSKKQAGKNNSKAIIAILIAVIVLLAGALVFVIANKGDKPAEEITPEAVETVTEEAGQTEAEPVQEAEKTEAEPAEEAEQTEAEPAEEAEQTEAEPVQETEKTEAEPAEEAEKTETASEAQETPAEEEPAAEETGEEVTEAETADETESMPLAQG